MCLHTGEHSIDTIDACSPVCRHGNLRVVYLVSLNLVFNSYAERMFEKYTLTLSTRKVNTGKILILQPTDTILMC